MLVKTVVWMCASCFVDQSHLEVFCNDTLLSIVMPLMRVVEDFPRQSMQCGSLQVHNVVLVILSSQQHCCLLDGESYQVTMSACMVL